MKHTRRMRASRTLALLLAFGVCGASGLGAAATVQVQIKLTPNIPIPGYGFGWSSAVDGNTAVVGAPFASDQGLKSGAVFVFGIQGQQIQQLAKLKPQGPAPNQLFGWSVAINRNLLAVGAPASDGASAGAVHVFRQGPGGWNELAVLTQSDPGPGDEFGLSVDVDGNTVVVGAPKNDDAGVSSGSAYVFVCSPTSCTEQAKLTAHDAQGGFVVVDEVTGDQFGFGVAISGETILVGARMDADLGPGSGSAYVFDRNGNVWRETAKLKASDGAPADRFGRSLALSRGTAVISARLHNLDGAKDAGAAYVFARSGQKWTEQAKLVADDAETSDIFGHSVDTDGGRVVVSAHYGDDACPSDDLCNSGAAYLFEHQGGSWQQKRKYTACDAARGDFLGHSVALGSLVMAGAPLDDEIGESSGSVYFFAP